MEKRTGADLLRSFVQAISHYFAWLCGLDMHSFAPEHDLTEEILRAYSNFRGE